MKRIIISLSVLTTCILYCNAQKADSLNFENGKYQYDFYMQKSQSNNLTGCVLLASGALLGLIGYIQMSQPVDNWWDLMDNSVKGVGLAYIGAITAAVSIPFFYVGSKNKQKANLLLEGSISKFNNGISTTAICSGITLKIKLKY